MTRRTQAEAGRIESPCVDVCELGAGDVCIGCYRSLDEIGAWTALDEAGKRRVLGAAEARRRAANRKRNCP